MRRAAFAAVLAAFAAADAWAAARFEIERYRATLFVHRGIANVDARIEIAYRVISGEKVTGLKSIGPVEPINLLVRDDEGDELVSFVNYGRPHRVVWHFRPVREGARKTVTLSFTAPGAMTATPDGKNLLVAEWAAPDFGVPVKDAQIRVEFPSGYAPANAAGGKGRWETSGRGAAFVVEEPAKGLRLEFSPPLFEEYRPPATRLTDRVFAALASPWVPVALLAALGAVWRLSRRGRV